MAEGDTILRLARRLADALEGRTVELEARPRGRAAGLRDVKGAQLEWVESRGKHLLLHLGELVLHSHLAMSGSWQVARRGARWRKPAASAWAVLRAEDREAVQFGGPTLRLLGQSQLRADPLLARLGPDILAPNFDASAAERSLRSAAEIEVGEALLDQRLVAGIGNIFKSESCFDARIDPWGTVGELDDGELSGLLGSARRLMADSAEERRSPFSVYRRSGRPCPRCGAPISARGQGDAARRTYWCPRCQAPPRSGANRAK